MESEEVIRKGLMEIEYYSEVVRMEALNRLGWNKSVRSSIGFWWLSAAVSYK